MKILAAALVGFAIQAIGLSAFVMIASSSSPSPGKQAVMGVTFVALATLLFFASRPFAFGRSIFLSALMALGYLVAYHLLGATYFPGLLKDLPIPSIEHFLAILPIFGLLFLLYFAGCVVVGLVHRLLSRRHVTHPS